MKSKFVYVPQGCYAEIKDTTPGDIIGLATSGVDTCCHIIVGNRKTKHIILCHADALTDLTNADNGVPAWIKKVCPNGDYKDLFIDMGESQDSRRDHSPGFYEQVKQVLDAKDINITPSSTCCNYGQYGISISKEDLIPKEAPHFKDDLRQMLSDNDKDLIELRDSTGNRLYSGILSARSYANNTKASSSKPEEIKFPPICVFDGSSNNFLNIEQMRELNGDIIDWGRAERFAPSRDSSPPSNEHASAASVSTCNHTPLSTAEAIKAQNQSYSRSSSGRKSDLSDLTVDQSINTYEESTKTESSFNSSPSQSTIHTDKAVANTQRSSVSSISGSSLNSSYSQSTIHTDKAVTNTQRSSVSSISGSSVHAEDVATSHHSMSSKAMMNVLRARSPTPVQNLPGQIAPSVTPNLTTNDKGHHK